MKKYIYSIASLLLLTGLSLVAQQQKKFNFTGSVQTFTVPPCVTSITVDLAGAKGGDHTGDWGSSVGGKGGRVTGTISVKPGDILYIYVGGAGGGITKNVGGFNGGGDGGDITYCSGGGGASDIRVNGEELSKRIFVAGGGGGAATNCWGKEDHGGAGGGLTGGNGCECNHWEGGAPSYPGSGGTQDKGGYMGNDQGQGGVTHGELGQGGHGAFTYGGGGGGGYYGGGGSGYGGGGGGSSYADPSAINVEHTQGYQDEDGYVIITCANGPISFSLQDTISFNSIPLELTADGPGGTFSGPGVKEGKFYPNLAGVGTWTISYTNLNSTCEGTVTKKITVLSSNVTVEHKFNTILNIYPNPAHEMINIYVATGINDMTVEIINIEGQTVYSNSGITLMKGGIMRIDVSEMAVGVYFVKLTSGSEVFTKKITIQK
jgi:hypothetical protein